MELCLQRLAGIGHLLKINLFPVARGGGGGIVGEYRNPNSPFKTLASKYILIACIFNLKVKPGYCRLYVFV